MKNPLHRLSLRTLKLFLRFMRRTHELFTGAGVAFISAALIVGLFMLVWWGIGAVKSAIELHLERALVERLLSLVTERTDITDKATDLTDIVSPSVLSVLPSVSSVSDGLVSASFSDLFSGTGWLDEAATTMYHDKNATAFLFEPQFGLQKGTPPAFANAQGTSGNGTVEKRGDIFEGRVNGELLVSSPYEGTFGFGGSSDNSLVVYGAYEGAGFQFLNGTRRDISKLFGIRMMGGGFTPTVVRDARMAAWYVFPRLPAGQAGAGAPVRFLKLFENENGEIIGATDLTNRVSERVGSGAALTDIRAGTDGSVWMEFAVGGAHEWYRFVDEKFEWTEKTVVSGDLNEGREAAVRRARVGRVNLANVGAAVRFFLANSDGEWFPVRVGEWLTFPDESGKNLFWKAVFTTDNTGKTTDNTDNQCNPPLSPCNLFSPYFDLIQVEYFLKF